MIIEYILVPNDKGDRLSTYSRIYKKGDQRKVRHVFLGTKTGLMMKLLVYSSSKKMSSL